MRDFLIGVAGSGFGTGLVFAWQGNFIGSAGGFFLACVVGAIAVTIPRRTK